MGGNARYFVRARSEDDLIGAVEYASRERHELFVLGGGSNILVSDAGFDGVVVHVGLKGMSGTGPVVTAAAGEDWDAFVAHCVDRDLAGLECMSGIPGSVGGTPVQNVGAYGQEVSETIASVRCFDRHSKSTVTLLNAECGFSYRASIFNSSERDRYIVLAVNYELNKGGAPKIAYKDLAEYFAGRLPTLAETRAAVSAIRKTKSMVIDREDPNSQSAGSFFKNPVVESSVFEELKSKHDRMPSFPFGEMIKIPAAWLIENTGFRKGFQLGRAGISTNHSLALINRGGATAGEIIDLKDRIQAAVEAKFGIRLVPEPVFVGFSQKS